jgi:hypothetical protein
MDVIGNPTVNTRGHIARRRRGAHKAEPVPWIISGVRGGESALASENGRKASIASLRRSQRNVGSAQTADFVSDRQVVQCRILLLSSLFAFRAATYARRLRLRPRILPCDDNRTEASVVFLAISEACRPWCGSGSWVLPASDLGIIRGAFRLMRAVDGDGANF